MNGLISLLSVLTFLVSLKIFTTHRLRVSDLLLQSLSAGSLLLIASCFIRVRLLSFVGELFLILMTAIQNLLGPIFLTVALGILLGVVLQIVDELRRLTLEGCLVDSR